MHRFLGFLGMVILLLAMVNHAHADTGREDAEGLRSRVVLKGGEIGSSTVEVGALKATEPKEITIYILGEHKAVVTALLEAVDEETPVIGIADFDSLSATHGLIGIYRKGRKSSGFYGHRFRLKFSPAADVSTIAGAYWSLPYVKSVEPEPPPDAQIRKADDQDRGLMRVIDILIVGGLMYGIYKLIHYPWGWGE